MRVWLDFKQQDNKSAREEREIPWLIWGRESWGGTWGGYWRSDWPQRRQRVRHAWGRPAHSVRHWPRLGHNGTTPGWSLEGWSPPPANPPSQGEGPYEPSSSHSTHGSSYKQKRQDTMRKPFRCTLWLMIDGDEDGYGNGDDYVLLVLFMNLSIGMFLYILYIFIHIHYLCLHALTTLPWQYNLWGQLRNGWRWWCTKGN